MEILFSHERLEAYRVAREFRVLAHAIEKHLPKCDLREQLTTAADSILLNTAEGAGRRSGRDKARFYDYARASAEECAAILDDLAIRELASTERTLEGRALLHRAVRLLSGLARSALRRSVA
jgi:four helix bundle protein